MLAREGWGPVAVVCGCAALVTYAWGVAWAVPAWLLSVGLAWLFIEPRRTSPALPLGVVSPVDGKIVSLGETRDPWLERDALSVTVRMKEPGISSLRSPIEGKVMDLWTNHGSSEAPWGSPTRYTLWIRSDEGVDIAFSLSTRFFSRFKCDVAPGERVGYGKRNGFVYLGQRVEILMPANSRLHVNLGDTILAGSGVIATLVR